jgi:hypothetical protein
MDRADENAELGAMTAFGIDISQEDLSQEDLTDIFTTCVSCFDYGIGRDPNDPQALKLSVIRLRLTRWGEAVNIHDKAAFQNDAHPDDLIEVRESLVDIISLFNIEHITPNMTITHMAGIENDTKLLQDTLEKIASERPQRGNNILNPKDLKMGPWSDAQFKRAARSIGCLESVVGSKHLRELCARERLRINNKEAIELLETTAGGLDPWMSKTSEIYSNNVIFLASNLGFQLGNNWGNQSNFSFGARR